MQNTLPSPIIVRSPNTGIGMLINVPTMTRAPMRPVRARLVVPLFFVVYVWCVLSVSNKSILIRHRGVFEIKSKLRFIIIIIIFASIKLH